MKPLTDPADVVPRLLAQAEVDHHALRAEIEAAGGPEAWWRAHFAAEPPESLTLEGMLRESAGYWDWAIERQAQCDRCPPAGAACSGPADINRGRFPVWNAERPTMARCTRWIKYVHRQWMIRAGVDPRNADHSLDTFELVNTKDGPVIHRFLDEQTRGWLVVSGPTEAGKTHLAVAILRDIKCRKPGIWCWYVNTQGLSPSLKKFYAQQSPDDPLAPVKETQLVVIDNLDLTKSPAWFKEAFEDVLLYRYNQQLPTLITTHESFAQMVKALPQLTGFARTANLSLTVRIA